MRTRPLSQEVQTLLGPVTHETLSRGETPVEAALPIHSERVRPLPETMWPTDGSSRGSPATVAARLDTDELWFGSGSGQSSQWAELRAVWMVWTQEPGPVAIGTDSGAVFKGLPWLLPKRHKQQWTIGHRPVRGQEMGEEIQEVGTSKEAPTYH